MDREVRRICIDVYTPRRRHWMKRYTPKTIQGTNGPRGYTLTVDPNQKNRVVRRCQRRNLQYRWYEERWGRSSNYRDRFLREVPGPYRCRYCGRRLTEKPGRNRSLVVDHIVPVARAKESRGARILLSLQGISSVNDPKNLAPSCRRCNQRKGDRMGLWSLRGILRRHLVFRIASLAVRCAVVVLLLYLLWRFVLPLWFPNLRGNLSALLAGLPVSE